MFNFFKKKNNSNGIYSQKAEKQPLMSDIDQNPLKEGDIVECLRDDLGKCKLVLIEGKFYYESLETGDKVIWLKMVDAATDLQKVRKLQNNLTL